MKQRQFYKQYKAVNGKLLFATFFIFHFSFLTISKAQINNALTKRETNERDSLMAVSILNLDSDFVFVLGDSFEMGLPDASAVEGGEIEKPQHKVNLKSFYILKTPVTQALWYSVMDTNPSFHKNCYACPVENISWYDAQTFINKINALKKGHYRLPTEAEYEYAARGGKKSHNFNYSGSNNANDVAWYTDNSNGQTHHVGEKKPNELSIVDMSGNIWEWCSDWYQMYYYKESPSDNPQGPVQGEKRVVRGGTWLSLDEGCMVTARGALLPASKDKFTGFRIIRDL
jgi:formylglycine-generating enzyme required for sulfatase activity